MKRMILAAMMVIVSILSTGCAKRQLPDLQPTETQAPAQTEFVETVVFEIATQQETILPEKAHQIKPHAPSKTVSETQSIIVEQVEREETILTEPVIEINLSPEQPTTIPEEVVTGVYSAHPTA